MTPGGVVGVGNDLVEVARLSVSLERTPTLLHRLFTAHEQDLAGRAGSREEFLAGRFAVKESVMKVLGRGIDRIAFTDIEVGRDEEGAPRAVLSGDAAARATELGIGRWHVTVSHAAGLAFAVAIGAG